MSNRAQNLKLGIFVVLSFLIAVSLFIWLGASRYLENSNTAVAYFTESVQGLEADSPVKFRGVPVGRVRAIRMAQDGRLIEVVMALDRSFKLTDDLGIKINLLGLTGQKYLEIDTARPDQFKAPINLNFTPRYRVITTYPSDIKEFGSALELVFQKVKGVELERLSNYLLRISARLDKILSDPKMDNTGVDAAEALKEIRDAAKKLNEELTRAQFGKSFAKTMEKTQEFLQESAETVRNADRAIRRTDNVINRLSQKLDKSADNLLDFTKMIRQKPSSIIFGPDEKTAPKR
jgi:phospholipid/cholesterol/gamma-HCH transport system substrate-binding protein